MTENSLHLEGMDNVELLENVEESLGIKFSDEEAESCITVGNFYDAILSKFAVPKTGQPVCFTTVSFYRLRRAVRTLRSGPKLKTGDCLSAVIEERDWKPIWAQLQRQSGMAFPSLHLGWATFGATAVLLTAPFWLTAILEQFEVHWTAYLIPFALAAVPFVILRIAPGTRPQDETLGDLAKDLAILNIGDLAREYQWWREKDLWDALIWHCREISVVEIPITRETRFT